MPNSLERKWKQRDLMGMVKKKFKRKEREAVQDRRLKLQGGTAQQQANRNYLNTKGTFAEQTARKRIGSAERVADIRAGSAVKSAIIGERSAGRVADIRAGETTDAATIRSKSRDLLTKGLYGTGDYGGEGKGTERIKAETAKTFRPVKPTVPKVYTRKQYGKLGEVSGEDPYTLGPGNVASPVTFPGAEQPVALTVDRRKKMKDFFDNLSSTERARYRKAYGAR